MYLIGVHGNLHVLVRDLHMFDVLHVIPGQLQDIRGDVLQDGDKKERDARIHLVQQQFLAKNNVSSLKNPKFSPPYLLQQVMDLIHGQHRLLLALLEGLLRLPQRPLVDRRGERALHSVLDVLVEKTGSRGEIGRESEVGLPGQCADSVSCTAWRVAADTDFRRSRGRHPWPGGKDALAPTPEGEKLGTSVRKLGRKRLKLAEIETDLKIVENYRRVL